MGYGMTAALQRVSGQREWSGQYGPMISINLDFGEFEAQLNTKPETLVKRLEQLEGLVGKESDEWAFQDTGTFDNGNAKPKKVSNYPGKAPAPQQGGGGKGRSPELEAFIQERMDRRTAIMQAVALLTAVGAESHAQTPSGDCLVAADHFYNWLRKTSGAATSPPGSDRTAAPEPTSPAPAISAGSVNAAGTKAGGGDGTGSASTTPAPAAGDSSAAPEAADTGQAGVLGEGAPACPPHLLDYEQTPKAGGRLPCKRCHAWVKEAA